MPQIALFTALILIVEGLYGYFGAMVDDRSMTALIPLFFGIPIGLSGLLAMKESYRMHAMHAAVSFGLLGAFAAWGRTAMTVGKMSQGIEYNHRAATMVLIMAIICTGFVVMCVRSFISARKRQRAEKAES